MAQDTPKQPQQSGQPGVVFHKRKRARTGCLSGVVYFLALIAVSFALAAFGWACANDVLALNKKEVRATLDVPDDFTISQLAKNLKQEGIIEYEWLFNLYARFSKAESKIDPGRYEMKSTLDYRALVYAMTGKSNYRETVRIVFREGLTLTQTLELLAENDVASMDDLLNAAEHEEFNYSFLEGVPEGPNRLEGYLYPDTYDFYIKENPRQVLGKFLLNFDRKLTEDFRQRVIDTGYTLNEILTIASMIQMEAIDDLDERKDIASVIYNRLEKWSEPYLQIDATLQYLLPERKERLYDYDKEIDSPYNTYKYQGLPPGPICSPALDSIRAALYPSTTSYYYYALTEEGRHQFSKTPAEHEKVKKDNPGIYG